MDDIAYIGFINAHAERNCCDNDGVIGSHELLLRGCSGLGCHTRVVFTNLETGSPKYETHAFRLLVSLYVDYRRSFVFLEELNERWFFVLGVSK